ncbi:MAG: PTS glucose transporter subunit IIA [Erysipelotrichaceae bacterium]|uniref:PTS sugar transporter subunit IIA n=1 Tax=Floccifex sp. TaxID=2815810 RepID=UPI002A75B865|nr:PTS glucose transporter subunit IIA [Floccifex sp.]MDD7280702.1 PTS glucose transporter subunit IIA [Erysipelotrichaceae bacterium]MDY2959132.1 PTS glucose transporter subunit IIA [Floccifex sp.]
MLSFLKKNKNKQLVAVIDGKCIPIEQVNDQVFASKAMGDGVGIVPNGNVVVSPCDGNLTMVASTKHAFGLTGKDGIEVMVHIGIDTVALGGNGFTVLVEQGCDVKMGQPIIEFDAEFMKSHNLDMTTMMIVLNEASHGVKEKYSNKNVKCGKDIVIEYGE